MRASIKIAAKGKRSFRNLKSKVRSVRDKMVNRRNEKRMKNPLSKKQMDKKRAIRYAVGTTAGVAAVGGATLLTSRKKKKQSRRK